MIASPGAVDALLAPSRGGGGSGGGAAAGRTHEKTAGSAVSSSSSPPPMDSKQVWEWYNSHPLFVGFNYIPRTAVNFVDMWSTETFDLTVIDEELSWAVQRGYNSVRTNLCMVHYEDDVDTFTTRVNNFLHLCAKHNLSVVLCPMDDCEFGGPTSAAAAAALPPVLNVHNSRAVGSPGRAVVMDPSQWHRVETYVRYVVRTWGGDSRVVLWDLWNEPGNPWEFTADGTRIMEGAHDLQESALTLLEHVFAWARQEHPLQPLTTSAWHVPDPFIDNITDSSEPMIALSHPIDQRAMQLSDVISIHAYCGPELLHSILSKCRTVYDKPILLTEWMARHANSTFASLLGVLEEYDVGSYQWGLVAGKSQTYLPWPHVADTFRDSQVWFHDVLNPDGTAHDEEEMTHLRDFATTVQDRILTKRGHQEQQHKNKTMVITNHDSSPQVLAPVVESTVPFATTSQSTTTPSLNAIMNAVVELAVHQHQEQALLHQQQQQSDGGLVVAMTTTSSTAMAGDLGGNGGDRPNLLY